MYKFAYFNMRKKKQFFCTCGFHFVHFAATLSCYINDVQSLPNISDVFVRHRWVAVITRSCFGLKRFRGLTNRFVSPVAYERIENWSRRKQPLCSDNRPPSQTFD